MNNMKARDELKQIEEVGVSVFESEEVTIGEVYKVNCAIIDDYLKALELIVNKGVDVGTFKEEIGWNRFNYEYYLKHYKNLSLEELTKEEFDFIVKVVKEIMENG